MGKTFAGLVVIFLIFFNPLLGQDIQQKYAKGITARELKEHLAIIASDSFQGRETGELGQKLAGSYISDQFKIMGLKPPVSNGDSLSFLQSFDVFKKSWDDPYLIIEDQKKTFIADFFSIANPDISEEENLDVTFGGYGPEDISRMKINTGGKAVVLFSSKISEVNQAARKQKNYNLILTSGYSKKYRDVLNEGARAVFIVVESDSMYNSFTGSYKCSFEETEILVKPTSLVTNNIFFIPPSLGAIILGIDSLNLHTLRTKQEPFSKADMKLLEPKNIRIKASKKIEEVETENILGYIEGTDRKEEVLIITAHYDHEGIKCGEIYNGADDDGTGTSTILELAEAFADAKKEGLPPRRSILFMAVTGEEKGLLGSSYYTDNPIFPLANTIANLNIDMIGRIDESHKNENYIYLIGSDRLSTQLHKINEEVNKKYTNLQLDYKYNAKDDPNQFYYRSDHYNFARKNIPVIFYFSGIHADYHKPTDDIEKILFSKVEKTARLVFHTAWELVNREERVVVDVK